MRRTIVVLASLFTWFAVASMPAAQANAAALAAVTPQTSVYTTAAATSGGSSSTDCQPAHVPNSLCANWLVYRQLHTRPDFRAQIRACLHGSPHAWQYCTARALRSNTTAIWLRVRYLRASHDYMRTPQPRLNWNVAQLYATYHHWGLRLKRANRLPSCQQMFGVYCGIMKCMHVYEGAWNAVPATSGGPFYGGMQEMYGFQVQWGPEFMHFQWVLHKYPPGHIWTANTWPPLPQMIAAYRAIKALPYWKSQWPVSSGKCT